MKSYVVSKISLDSCARGPKTVQGSFWLHDHKLTLNLDKTKCMLIGSNRKRESKVDLTVSILDHSISNVRSFKYLGIHISSDFTWTDHIEHLTGKINHRGLGFSSV